MSISEKCPATNPLTPIANCNIVIADCNMKLGDKLRYLREVEGTLAPQLELLDHGVAVGRTAAQRAEHENVEVTPERFGLHEREYT